jgi:hypothetical protein
MLGVMPTSSAARGGRPNIAVTGGNLSQIFGVCVGLHPAFHPQKGVLVLQIQLSAVQFGESEVKEEIHSRIDFSGLRNRVTRMG